MRSDALDGIVGGSRCMEQLRRQIQAVAPLDSTVLLTGETGSGKGHIARALHRISPRAAQPFVHVDCAALSPTLIESAGIPRALRRPATPHRRPRS